MTDERPDLVCSVCGSDVIWEPGPQIRGLRGGTVTRRPSPMVPGHCSNSSCIRYRATALGWAIPRATFVGDDGSP